MAWCSQYMCTQLPLMLSGCLWAAGRPAAHPLLCSGCLSRLSLPVLRMRRTSALLVAAQFCIAVQAADRAILCWQDLRGPAVVTLSAEVQSCTAPSRPVVPCRNGLCCRPDSGDGHPLQGRGEGSQGRRPHWPRGSQVRLSYCQVGAAGPEIRATTQDQPAAVRGFCR